MVKRLHPILPLLATLIAVSTIRPQDSARRVTAVETLQRVALVIGNNAYPRMPLANSVNDARGMAAVLRESGFRVQEVENADLRGVEQAVQSFAAEIRPGDAALFFYSGHGIQIAGENYMVPVNFTAVTETDAKYQAFPIGRVADVLQERGARVKILILDACRDNPFHSARSAARGLAAALTPQGSLIAFATDPGRTADDNPAGGYGLFTKYLIDAMRIPGLKVEEVFSRAREGVVRESSGKQVPWTSSSLLGDFVFRAPEPAPAAPTGSSAESNADIVYWNSIKDGKNPSLFQSYLRRFPDGLFREIAEAKLAELAPAAGPATSPAPSSAAPPEAEKTFAVKHWHYSYRGQLSQPAAGKIWVRGGKIQFREDEQLKHNFSLSCAEIQGLEEKWSWVPPSRPSVPWVNAFAGQPAPASTPAKKQAAAPTASDVLNSEYVNLLIGKTRFSVSTQPADAVHDLVAAIKAMCGPTWPQSAAPARKR